MKPSVYVIRKSNGVKFCVNVEHYEQYKDDYTLVAASTPDVVKVEEVTEAPEVEKVISEVKKTRGRKTTKG